MAKMGSAMRDDGGLEGEWVWEHLVGFSFTKDILWQRADRYLLMAAQFHGRRMVEEAHLSQTSPLEDLHRIGWLKSGGLGIRVGVWELGDKKFIFYFLFFGRGVLSLTFKF